MLERARSDRAGAVKVDRGITQKREIAGGLLDGGESLPGEDESVGRVEVTGIVELDADLPAVEIQHGGFNPSGGIDGTRVGRIDGDGSAAEEGIGTKRDRGQGGIPHALADDRGGLAAADTQERTVAAADGPCIPEEEGIGGGIPGSDEGRAVGDGNGFLRHEDEVGTSER